LLHVGILVCRLVERSHFSSAMLDTNL
jgi:hypothetical protein